MAPRNSIQTEIGNLLSSQKYAVLSTQERNHPYLNLVAFAHTDHLRTVLFATPKGTRKFENLVSSSGVALLVDNRSNEAADIKQAKAVTVVGDAREVPDARRDAMEKIYLAKLPHMTAFLSSSATAFIQIDVAAYVLVRGFQDVSSWQVRTES